MALSNLRNEPRREITEQLFGILAVLGFMFCDYKFSLWFQSETGGYPGPGCPWWIGIQLGILFSFIILIGIPIIWYLIHAVGESVCGLLTTIGLDPRPRDRMKRWG